MKDIILILLVIGMIYLLFFKKTSENFGPSQADINQMIANTYQVDLDAMRNLGQISNNILTNDTLTLPAFNTNAKNINLSGDLVIEDSFTLDTPFNYGGTYSNRIAGPFSNIAPANNKTGYIFTVPVTGDYILNIFASGMSKTIGFIIIKIWIDGNDTGRILKVYTNEIESNAHITLIPISFRYTLNSGNHYLYLSHLAGYSDIEDNCSFNWIFSPVIV